MRPAEENGNMDARFLYPVYASQFETLSSLDCFWALVRS